jgi:hypothetical protein
MGNNNLKETFLKHNKKLMEESLTMKRTEGLTELNGWSELKESSMEETANKKGIEEASNY